MKIEVVPHGRSRWAVRIHRGRSWVLVGSFRTQREADLAARTIGEAVEFGRAELVLKDRRGRIRKGPGGKETYGFDPRRTRG